MALVVLGLGLLLCAVSGGSGSPVKKVYDQRQQGELNIHAQLDNIVIVLIPTSKISLMEVASQQNEDNLVSSTSQVVKPEKNGFLQFLQKHIKNDIDRFGVVKGEEDVSPQNENEVVSQEVVLKIEKEKDSGDKKEEVVATVEEMKQTQATERTTDLPKSEVTEDTPIKEHSTVSESVHQTVFKVSIPDELKDAVKKAQEESKKEEDRKRPEQEVGVKESTLSIFPLKLESAKEKQETKLSQESSGVKKVSPPGNKQETSSLKETSVKKVPSSGSLLDELIRPLASKDPQPTNIHEETGEQKKSLVEGGRKEKVIRYKPEAKWAPGLVDLLGPVRSRGLELEERQRFTPLCSPGVWDAELKTCIMPGETRSRNELARFLEAMRFGIALPAQ